MFSAGPDPQSSAAPSDAGDNPPWKSDNESYFADQEYSLLSPMSHYPGSLNLFVQFLSDILDWNSFDKSVLDHMLQGLPVPIPSPAPSGISLQEAINVSPPPQHIIIYTILYTISYCIKKIILLYSNCRLAENRHVMCVVKKARFEPRTFGTRAERATNCATAPVVYNIVF